MRRLDLRSSVVIWTTTPWTIPANRAISFSSKIAYGLYRVTSGAETIGRKWGDLHACRQSLRRRRVQSCEGRKLRAVSDIDPQDCLSVNAFIRSPRRYRTTSFKIPLLDGDHVTDDTGTGFVHTAPGHGRDDFDIWMAHGRELAARGIDTRIPYTVDADGFFTKEAPGFTGRRVIDDKGNKGDANEAVIKALIEAGNLVARGKLKHQYPHSWRSKKPVIFRNTPQWFIALDKPMDSTSFETRAAHAPQDEGALRNTSTLREIALSEIARTKWYPAAGENRITGMIANRPDWVVSRQRAWGVPIAIFVNKDTKEILDRRQGQPAHRRRLRARRRRRLVRGRRRRALSFPRI